MGNLQSRKVSCCKNCPIIIICIGLKDSSHQFCKGHCCYFCSLLIITQLTVSDTHTSIHTPTAAVLKLCKTDRCRYLRQPRKRRVCPVCSATSAHLALRLTILSSSHAPLDEFNHHPSFCVHLFVSLKAQMFM